MEATHILLVSARKISGVETIMENSKSNCYMNSRDFDIWQLIQKLKIIVQEKKYVSDYNQATSL